MPRPPIRGKFDQGPPGRTRADVVDQLLAPKKKQKPVSHAALQRAALANTAFTLGSPLAGQVRTRGTTQLRQQGAGLLGWSPQLIGAAFAATAGLLLLAGVNLFFVLPAVCIFFGIGFAVGRSLQSQRAAKSLATEIDLASRFDAFVEQHAARYPGEALDALRAIKESLSQLLPKLSAIQAGGMLTQDDVFFIQQTVLRYLPDASNLFFAIPEDKRDVALLEQDKTPKQALLEQFQMVGDKLRLLQEQLVKSEAQKLAQHKRFLERKTSV